MERDPMKIALSTDVVMAIVLSHLKVRDLLSCRKVSKFWNKEASSVLRKRSTMMKTILNENQLMELQECIKSSSDFPFPGLMVPQPWQLKSGDAKKFFQNYGERFTRLCLDTRWEKRLCDLAPFVILLPRLSILEVNGPFRVQHGPRLVEVFDSAAPHEDGAVLKLPSVRIIRILFPKATNKYILQEILTAASPSVQVECLNPVPGILRSLRSSGKLQAVSVMKFLSIYERQCLRNMDELLSIESPSLCKLECRLGSISMVHAEKILVSSQHTLKELCLEGPDLDEYSWENLPVLPKLSKLTLRFAFDFCRGSLFKGRHGDKFPALKEIHLYYKCCIEENHRNVGRGYSSGLFVVPSVTRLDLGGYVDEDGMEQLAHCFPNVIQMRIEYSPYDQYLSRLPTLDPCQIWSVGKFKLLEKLRIWNVTFRPHPRTNRHRRKSGDGYANRSMDSFLTGIPVDICRDLHEQIQLGSTDSPTRQVVRNKPSVLQLENLKELVVCVEPASIKAPEGTPFISMVSVRYALDMMPNLEAKFVYPHRPHLQEHYSEILEAAFKHVQPSIKVEPFFY